MVVSEDDRPSSPLPGAVPGDVLPGEYEEDSMMRFFSVAIAGLVLVTGLTLAADHRGYLKSVGANKLTVTVEDKGKEKDLEIATNASTKFYGGKATIATAELNKLIKEAEGKGLRVRVKTKDSRPEVATEVRVAVRRSKGSDK